MTKRSKKKKRRYGQIVKKEVTDEPSLSMVSSTTSSHLVALCDELDTKENNQSDMNSLDNSPSSTTSSKKCNTSPFQTTTAHALRLSLETCESVLQIPSQGSSENNVTMRDAENRNSVASVPIPSVYDSSTENCRVTSTTDVLDKESDSLILNKRKRRKKNKVSSSVGTQVNESLIHNSTNKVIESSGPCCSEVDGNEEVCDLNDVNIPPARKIVESSSAPDAKDTRLPKKIPDSFEELILMHFNRELNVGEMIESMSCLMQNNQTIESELSQLVGQVDLLRNGNQQLENVSFKWDPKLEKKPSPRPSSSYEGSLCNSPD